VRLYFCKPCSPVRCSPFHGILEKAGLFGVGGVGCVAEACSSYFLLKADNKSKWIRQMQYVTSFLN
jgi:hypothetical protein